MDLLHAIEKFLLEFSVEVYDTIGWFGVAVLMAIESTAVPLPSEVVMPMAGWRLIADRNLGLEWVFIAGLWGGIGSVAGSLAEYYVARAGGRPLIEKYGKYMLVTRKDLERADSWFATRGELTIFIGRLIPGVRHFISIPAGVARMNVIRFAIFTFLGAFPWSLALAWAGFELGKNYEAIREFTRPFVLPLIILAILAGVAFIAFRIREIREESKQAEPEDGHSPT